MKPIVPLSEAITLQRGFDLPTSQRKPGKYPVVTSTGMTTTHNESKVKGPGVVIGRSGSIGGGQYIADEFWPLNTTLWVKDFKGNNEKFIYYLLKSLDFSSFNAGAAVPTLNRNHLSAIKVKIPSRPDQDKVANILGTIDEKIELNRKINKTLEQMGQALFRHYFIDNTETAKWECVKLKHIVNNVKQSLKAGEHLVNHIYLPIDRLQMRSLSVFNPSDYTEAKSSLIAFEKNDILVGAMRVYFHRVNLAPSRGVTRTTTFVLRPKEEYLGAFATFLINQDSTVAYANAHSKGTTMPYAIWENGLGDMVIRLPPDELLQRFHAQTWPMLEVIRDSYRQIQTLTTLRDTLLPRLINGKVKA